MTKLPLVIVFPKSTTEHWTTLFDGLVVCDHLLEGQALCDGVRLCKREESLLLNLDASGSITRAWEFTPSRNSIDAVCVPFPLLPVSTGP